MNKYDKALQFLGILEILQDREQMTDKERELFGHLFEIIDTCKEMRNKAEALDIIIKKGLDDNLEEYGSYNDYKTYWRYSETDDWRDYLYTENEFNLLKEVLKI